MRVLAIGNMYPPHHLGGYELIWESATRHLERDGHAVRVLTSDYRLERASGPEGGDVHRELRSYWRDHAFPRLSPRARLALEVHNAGAFDRHLDEFRPDVLCWWAMGGMSLSLIERGRRRGLPAVGVVCDDWMLYAPRVDAWTRMWSTRAALAALVERLTGIPTRADPGLAGRWLFLSETLRRRALAAGLEPGRAEVCHRGVEPDLFSAARPRRWGWRLLYVGRIDPRKGIDIAIGALAGLPQATLRVVGAGDDAHLAELRDLAERLGVADRVTFTHSPRSRLQNVYASADAVLFPVRWEEPWGLVPLEAMAVGTPVIASGRGGSAEYLRAGANCLIADPDRGPDGFVAALRELASGPELRARLRAGGLETVARLRVDAFDGAVARLLERAAEPGRAAPGQGPETARSKAAR